MATTERRAKIIIEARDDASRVISQFGNSYKGVSQAKARVKAESIDLERAIKAERKTLIDAAQGNLKLSESLSTVTSKKGAARIAAQQLNEQVRAGQITVAQYKDAMAQLQTRFDLSTEAGRRAGASLSKLNADFAAGKISAKQYADGLDKVQASMQKTQTLGDRLRGGLHGIGQAAGTIAKAGLVAFGAAAVGAVAASIKLGMSMEQTRMAFKTMLGSAEAATKHLEELRAFAAKTPFQFTDLVQASRRLMAFGFEAKKVVPMLRDIGDAVAAMGGSSDIVDRVTLALGQMSAKGKVSAQEMLQLTEAGIPAWRYMAEAIGVSTAEVQKMSEKGLIPADKAIQAILNGMRQDFGGMMAEQSKTAAGQLSNVVDLLTETATTFGEALLPAAKSVIENGLLPFANALKSLVVGGKEVNEELMRLSESPYILEKAFGRTVLASRAAGESTKLYNEHLIDMRARLVSGKETQGSFVDELIRSRNAIVRGLSEMGKYDEAVKFLNEHTEEWIESQVDLARIIAISENETSEAERAMARMGKTSGAVDTSMRDLAESTGKLTKEQKAMLEGMTGVFDLAVEYTKRNQEIAALEEELAIAIRDRTEAGKEQAAALQEQINALK